MQRTVFCLLFTACACAYALLPGCNAVGAAVNLVSPPELVDAKYELPDKPTLIVIDDPAGLINNQGTLRQIAVSTQTTLETEQVVTQRFVTQGELSAYRDELGPAYQSTTLAGLAMHFDVKQVVHAEVVDYQMDMGGSVVRPSITLNIRVFDLDERGRVFPARTGTTEQGSGLGAPFYQFVSRLPARDLSDISAAREIAVRDLSNQAGRDIGRLFFDWRKPQPGSELGNR